VRNYKLNYRLVLAGVGLLALVAGALTLPLGEYATELVAEVRALGALGVVLYAGIYITATVALIPGSLLTLGAGFLYGVWGGAALVLPASVIGATLSFLLGRTVARDWVRRRIRTAPRLAAVDSAVGESAFTIIFLLRLSPVVPFALLNYFLGVTRARTRDYVAASITGMIPGVFLYVYIGSLLTSAAQIASGTRPDTGNLGNALLIVGLLATVAVTVYVSRLSRRKLRQTLGEDAEPVAVAIGS
jgi:uncharacterized membrane protein YdjX (TVP38/TMEM64 family)